MAPNATPNTLFISRRHTVCGIPFATLQPIGARAPWYSPHKSEHVDINVDWLQKLSTTTRVVKIYVWSDDAADIVVRCRQHGLAAAAVPYQHYPYVRGELTDLKSSLGKRTRKRIRQIERALEARGALQFVEDSIEQHPVLMRHFLDFSREKWERLGKTAKYSAPIHREFLQCLLADAARARVLALHSLRLNRQVIACHLGFRINGVLYYYFPAYDQKYRNFSPGFYLLYHIIRSTLSTPNMQTIDLGPGIQEYKMRFANGHHSCSLVCISSRRSHLALYTTLHQFTRQLQQWRQFL